jgi:hypothetical protein
MLSEAALDSRYEVLGTLRRERLKEKARSHHNETKGSAVRTNEFVIQKS